MYCRLNLEEGRFQESFSSHSPGINKLDISPAHGLVAAAGEEGLLECFDIRQERLAGRFDASAAVGHVSVSLLIHGLGLLRPQGLKSSLFPSRAVQATLHSIDPCSNDS